MLLIYVQHQILMDERKLLSYCSFCTILTVIITKRFKEYEVVTMCDFLHYVCVSFAYYFSFRQICL